MRSITIGEHAWKWQVGKQSILARCGERRLVIGIHTILGVTPDAYERAMWKRTNNCQVTPSAVRAWIERETTEAAS